MERNKITENLAKQAIEYKSKCLQIVLRYIDANRDNLAESELLQDCGYMTRAHFDDIIDERACADSCGYVLCGNVLSAKPQIHFKAGQTYHIRNNRVYDITRRKNFCSDVCFMSAEHLRNQISTEPILTRKATTLPLSLYTEKNGLAGDEVQLIRDIKEYKHEETIERKINKFQNKDIIMKEKTKQNILRNERKLENRIISPYIQQEELKELQAQFKNMNIISKG